MGKYLWACWDGGGNLTPSLGVAAALTRRGHEVVFAGRGQMLGRVLAAGHRARELTHAYTLIDRLCFHPQAEVFGYLASPLVGEELAATVAQEAPDAMVIDAMFSAALDVAGRVRIPTAVMLHTFARRMGTAWRANLAMQSEGRVKGGFAPLAPIDELWGARDMVHCNTLAAFDDEGDLPLANLRHGAPILYEEARAGATLLPWPRDDARPLVLLSFSTVARQRSPAALQSALDALAPLPVNVVVTTGGIVDPAELALPANAQAVAFASHDALMPRAALVVAHAGHGTTMRALRHGVPLVLTPAGAGDQPFVAAAVEAWGAGIALPREAAAEPIRAAAERVLAEPGYRRAATSLGARFAGLDGSELAAEALGMLLSRTPQHDARPHLALSRTEGA
jgi:UDP:flavonoid glycosyltransferase YjiC (YdhE family)